MICLAGCYADSMSIEPEWPKSVKQAVEITLSELSDNDKQLLQATKKTDLIQFHKTLGTGIRNDFGLLKGNDELRKAACAIDVSEYYPVRVFQDDEAVNDCHPDSASMGIIAKAWEALQSTTLPN